MTVDREALASAPDIQRYSEIDGIRGWAALVVVLYHFFYELFGVLMPELRTRRTAFIFEGHLAVYVFFILSGDALSVGYLRTGSSGVIDRLAAKRYFRLTIPILLACLIAYGLMKAGITFNHPSAVIVHREDWLGAFLPFEPDFGSMLQYALWDVYGNHTAITSYNPFMWTMSMEMIGSLAVFVFLYASPSLAAPLRTAAIVAVAFFVLGSWYALFFVGVTFGYLRRNGALHRLQLDRRWQVASALGMLATALGVSYLADKQWFWFDGAAAVVLVGAFYTNGIALWAFRGRVSQALGAISFPLYLVHFCVLVSITSYWITSSATLDRKTMLAIAAGSVATSLVAAAVFYQVEKRLLDLMNRVVQRALIKRTDR